MKPENGIICPECGSISCVVGQIDSRDSEYGDRYYFYPKNITQKSFWKYIKTRIDIKDNGCLNACYKCGYVWGRVNATELDNVLKKLEWDGGLQLETKRTITLPKITEWVLISIVLILFLFILYVYFKT